MGVVVTSFSVEHGHHAPSSSFVGESPSARIPFPFTLRALPSFTLTDINPCLDSRLPIDCDCSLQSIPKACHVSPLLLIESVGSVAFLRRVAIRVVPGIIVFAIVVSLTSIERMDSFLTS
ncbi:hypothetical protein KC19_12G110900 [Ceratodon purpureus]|uniref:Uncharacterized protein n=1 Tax=Ceratodon purpureus TaxID=3225 RepID=A0A8T0G6N2_CERPU|nr:hypothetical protein KC19_12G110900 [Ceratodon purpureus]